MADLREIMHIEDDADIRQIARMSLELVGGFSVNQFEGGQPALDAAPALRPDMILLDVMMPDMDGEETFHKLREIPGYEAVPIIFVTAKASRADFDRLREIGAAEVILKPFDPMSLPDQIREIWTRVTA
ncbi:response regulator receiver domain-containing protein [Rhodobacter sp. 140A]|uniref:Transcriptional regulatory protein CseB n=1 Tax=bioreactor metagenome TaxID=1076179 RepID=A0A644WM60_9ZZZZ|nr:response regulator receiver domain-containing protein [Rhodobacter sp. 140A]